MISGESTLGVSEDLIQVCGLVHCNRIKIAGQRGGHFK